MSTSEPKYEIKTGPLAETYGLFNPLTINTGAEISADRIRIKELRSTWFYVANASLATKRAGKLLLGISGRTAFNVVFGTDTEKTCQELRNTGYIHLNPVKRDLILRLEQQGEVTFIDPNDLKLEGEDAEYRQFSIRPKSYERNITIARLPFIHAGYGSGDMLRQVMNNLDTNRITKTTIFAMNPDHAAENVKDDEIIARASWLDYFDDVSFFDASVCVVNLRGALRGVLNPAEGVAKISHLEGLVGKGTDVGNNLVVIRREEISDKDYLF